MKDRLTPAKFLKLLRDSDPVFMTDLYENGGCYHLYRILATIWPDAEPWYDAFEGHVYTRIGGAYYDINGRTSWKPGPLCAKMTQRDQRRAQAKWLRRRFEATGYAKLAHPLESYKRERAS